MIVKDAIGDRCAGTVAKRECSNWGWGEDDRVLASVCDRMPDL